MDVSMITLAIALVALCLPWLYDGTLFTRQRAVSVRRDPLDKDEVRQRARRRL